MQQPVGEDVAAFAVSRKLRFVQRHEAEIGPAGHGFDRAQQPAGMLGFDPFLAGDQGYPVAALDRHHPVIDLAGQQAQGKADRARRVGAEPFDREVGLAGIGGAEHGQNLAVSAA